MLRNRLTYEEVKTLRKTETKRLEEGTSIIPVQWFSTSDMRTAKALTPLFLVLFEIDLCVILANVPKLKAIRFPHWRWCARNSKNSKTLLMLSKQEQNSQFIAKIQSSSQPTQESRLLIDTFYSLQNCFHGFNIFMIHLYTFKSDSYIISKCYYCTRCHWGFTVLSLKGTLKKVHS